MIHTSCLPNRRLPSVLVALLLALLALPARGGAAEDVPIGVDAALYQPVLAGARDAVIAETAGRLTEYRIEAELVPPTAEQPTLVRGTADIRFYNGTGRALDELFFRLYGNDEEYAEGALALEAVTVGGAATAHELSVADTVARVALPAQLETGETVDLAVDFVATVPTDPERSYGIFSYQVDAGTWALAHWYPVLAGYGADGRWNLEPPSTNGDKVFSNSALFEVELTTPPGLVVAATGNVVAEEEVGARTRHRIVTGPVRDIVLVVDDDYASISEEVDGTVVTSYYNPGNEVGARAVLRYGVQALAIFNELFGPYPYEEMDLVDVAVRNGAAGVEFPGLMFIARGLYDDEDAAVPGVSFLENVVAHEVAHQWWYGLVGNDQYVDAFIDEGLTNYVTVVYFEEQYGKQQGAAQENGQLLSPYLRYLRTYGDLAADQPTDEFPDGRAYGAIVYGKAPLGFRALRREIGDEAFFGALQEYAAAERFGVAVPADLRAAFERASGQDLTEFWRHWFEAAEGRQDFG